MTIHFTISKLALSGFFMIFFYTEDLIECGVDEVVLKLFDLSV